MKLEASPGPADGLTDECLTLLLEEAERAILTVEARADEPSRRILHGDVPDRDHPGPVVGELRLAIAELIDAYPSIPYDLEIIGERIRNVGANAGAGELEAHPHVLDLVRMSLEIFFRVYPYAEAYELDQRRAAEGLEEGGQTPIETYETYAHLLGLLRSRVS